MMINDLMLFKCQIFSFLQKLREILDHWTSRNIGINMFAKNIEMINFSKKLFHFLIMFVIGKKS